MVVAYDPFSPEALSDPWPIYRRLRDAAPVHRLEPYDAWALPRFAEVWEVLEDRDRFSIVEGPVFDRDRLLTPNAGPPSPSNASPASFATLDPPVHTRFRHAMHRSFTPRAAEGLGPEVAAIVAERLAALDGTPRFDVVADYAGPVAVASTLRFLDLPPDDALRLRSLVNASTRREPGRPGAAPAGASARHELHTYLCDHVRREPGELARALLALAPTAPEEVAVQLNTLLVGGVETLPKIVAGGLLRLSQEPDQLAALRGDAALLPGAFEEIVRLEGVLQHVGRTLLTDADIGGQPMRAGQRVFLLLQSANRDERQFDDPERFDVKRVIPQHVGFGHGTHFCIGIHTARTTGVALLRGFLDRFPSYRVDLAGGERPPSEFQIGWTRLPVEVG